METLAKTKIKQYSLNITIDNQKRKLICGAPTKTQFILHELVSQIPLFWNHEKLILAYLKGKVISLLKTRFFLPKILIKDEKL